MTALLVADDFTDAGALPNPPWGVGASQFVRENARAFGAASPALATATAFDPATILSASTPKKVRYELDVRMPAVFPATGEVRAGLGACMRSTGRDGFHLVYRRTSGGASALVELLIARPAGSALADVSLFSVFAPTFAALAAGATARLRLDVQLNASNVILNAYLDGVLLFVSTPTTTLFNATTGRSLAAMTAVTLYPAIHADAAGATLGPDGYAIPDHRVYVDRLRVLDVGNLALTPALSSAPTRAATPTLTPITPGAEDDGGSETLPVQPSQPIEPRDGWGVDEHPYDGGYSATVAQQTRRRRVWPFKWNALSSSQRDALEALWDAVNGTVGTFVWEDPETGAEIRLHFLTPLRVVRAAPAVWQADAEVEEVLPNA